MVDAAWNLIQRGDVHGGMGGIVRRNNGSMICCFSGPVKAFNIEEAELKQFCMIHKLFVPDISSSIRLQYAHIPLLQ